MDFPEHIYDNLLWLPRLGLIATTLDSHQPSDQQVKFAFEGDTQLRFIPFQPDPDCELHTRYYPVRTLPDGRVGVIKVCAKIFEDPTQDARYLMAYDFDSGEIEQIVAGKLPHRTQSHDFSWKPDMTRGVQELYD
jgi:hypothetical protein